MNIKHITKKRKQSKFLVHLLLGIVTGGNMSFGDNESYSIEVELTSVGEIPAYLQHHKNVRLSGDSSNINNSSDKFPMEDIEDDADEEKTIGRALFKQMYNDLPASKRIKSVKNLVNQSWAINKGNFVNMDKEIREDLIEDIKDTKLHGKEKGEDGGKLEIPSDVPLFDSNRYIRLALAFTILDLTHDENELKPVRVGCRQVSSTNPNINWRNTICRAFKNIYSADGSIMMIPNEKTPDFALKNALTADEDFANPIRKRGKEILTVSTMPEGNDDFCFPRKYKIEYEGVKSLDGDYECIEYEAYEWGYLKDLYIDFDFFSECIESAGLFTKDVYYKILNGLSSAVNMIWDFQIVESINGDNITYTVIDRNWVGQKPGNPKTFYHNGEGCRFLDSSLTIDIPGEMANQIINRRLGLATQTDAPIVKVGSGTFFAKGSDKFMKAVSVRGKNVNTDEADTPDPDTVAGKEKQIEDNKAEAEDITAGLKKGKPSTYGDRGSSTTSTPYYNSSGQKVYTETTTYTGFGARTVKTYTNTAEGNRLKDLESQNNELTKSITETKKSNLSSNVEKVEVIPKPIIVEELEITDEMVSSSENGNTSFRENFRIYCFRDTNLLDYLKNLKILGSSGRLSHPLPIKYSFTIFGTSGIRRGDMFNIVGIPDKYRKNGLFQVNAVTHTIEGMTWKTQVEGLYRQVQ